MAVLVVMRAGVGTEENSSRSELSGNSKAEVEKLNVRLDMEDGARLESAVKDVSEDMTESVAIKLEETDSPDEVEDEES